MRNRKVTKGPPPKMCRYLGSVVTKYRCRWIYNLVHGTVGSVFFVTGRSVVGYPYVPVRICYPA